MDTEIRKWLENYDPEMFDKIRDCINNKNKTKYSDIIKVLFKKITADAPDNRLKSLSELNILSSEELKICSEIVIGNMNTDNTASVKHLAERFIQAYFQLNMLKKQMQKYESICDVFAGVQFSKNFFNDISVNIISRWLKTITRKLYQYRNVLLYNQSGANDIKFLKGTDTVRKCRIGGNFRLMWRLESKEHIFTMLKISKHDNQDKVIMPSATGLIPGYVYWNMREFLRRILWLNMLSSEKKTAHNIIKYLNDDTHYVYDDNQIMAMEFANETLHNVNTNNVSLIGNAGSGKSVIGSSWLKSCARNKEKCIYLTMSKNLVNRTKEQFKTELTAITAEHKLYNSDMPQEIVAYNDTFTFMSQCLNNNTAKYLNPKQSYDIFYKTCLNIKNGWHGNKNRKIKMFWHCIHGVIKGGLSPHREINYVKEPIDVGEPLTKQEFCEHKLNSKRMLLTDDELQFLYKTVYPEYENKLRSENKYDDNDLARVILKLSRYKLMMPAYEAVFIDECQDLTEIQLLALNYALKNARKKIFASDRCQMIQPTFFQAGKMISYANAINGISAEQAYSQNLNFNYRSNPSIVKLQNEIVHNMPIALKSEEKIDIISMIENEGNADNELPILISSSDTNKESMLNMVSVLDEAQLKVIVSDSNNNDDVLSKAKAEDVYDCKGLEFPNILAWNIFSSAYDETNHGWDWKYFYVAATRARKKLIIYEDNLSENENVFFNKCAKEGKITICHDLHEKKDGTNETWYNWLLSWLADITDEDKLLIASNYEETEKYDQAAAIYEQFIEEGYEQDYQRCVAKSLLQKKKYDDFIRMISSIDQIEEVSNIFIEADDVQPRELLAYYIVNMNPDDKPGQELEMIKLKIFNRYGNDSINFKELLRSVVEAYPECMINFNTWKNKQITDVRKMARSIKMKIQGSDIYV